MKKKLVIGILVCSCCSFVACGVKDQPTPPNANENEEMTASEFEYVQVDITKWVEAGKKYEETGNLKLAWAQFIVASYYDPSNLESKLFEERNGEELDKYMGYGERPEDEECMDEIIELIKKEDEDAYNDFYRRWVLYVAKQKRRQDIVCVESFASGYREDILNQNITENVTTKTLITENNKPSNMLYVPEVVGMDDGQFYYTLDIESQKVAIYINDMEVYPNRRNADIYIGE